MFAHSPAATAEVVTAVGRVMSGAAPWAKLSPTVADLAEVAGAALAAGAEAVTLINTALGMAIDVERPAGSGSGPAVGAVGAGHPRGGGPGRLRRAGPPIPGAAIVGVGGVFDAARTPSS